MRHSKKKSEKPSTKDQVEGKLHDIKGQAKEVAWLDVRSRTRGTG